MINGMSLTGITRSRGVPYACIAVLTLSFCSCQGMRSRIAPRKSSSQDAVVSQSDESLSPTISVSAPPRDASRSSLSDDQVKATPEVKQVSHNQPPVVHEATSATPYANNPGPVMMVPGASYQPPAGPPCNCGAHTGAACGGWVPPSMAPPWREDEYLCDGGDQGVSVRVRRDWSVDGLDLEDTIVHYDTLDGQTHVEPSNVVCLYAPRFAAVRKIYGVLQYNQLDRVAGVAQPVPTEGVGDVQIATTTVQPVQPELNLGTKAASGLRTHSADSRRERSRSDRGSRQSVAV